MKTNTQNFMKVVLLFNVIFLISFIFSGCKTDGEIALEKAIKNKSIDEARIVIKKFPNEDKINEKVDNAVKIIKDLIDNSEYGVLIDSRDNKQYKTILMRDGNIWMAENLKYYDKSMKWNSWCPDNNCDEYGRLYTWKYAKKSCPDGWHLPTDDEWWKMIQYYGGADQAFLIRAAQQKNESNGEKAYWKLYKDTKFKAKLSGKAHIYDKELEFQSLRERGFYWTSSKGTDDVILYYSFEGAVSEIVRRTVRKDKKNSRNGFSCRCMKN